MYTRYSTYSTAHSQKLRGGGGGGGGSYGGRMYTCYCRCSPYSTVSLTDIEGGGGGIIASFQTMHRNEAIGNNY